MQFFYIKIYISLDIEIFSSLPKYKIDVDRDYQNYIYTLLYRIVSLIYIIIIHIYYQRYMKKYGLYMII